MYFVYYICTEKLRLPLWSCQNVLRILHHATLACTEKLRLSSRSCQSVLRILLKSCYFPAGAANVYFVYYTCTAKLRLSSWSWELAECTSHTTHLYGKVATFEPELPKHYKPMQRKKTDTDRC